MLRRMAMVVVAPAAFLVRDGGRGLVSVPQALDGFRRIPTNDGELLFVSAQVVKWRPFICQRDRQLLTRGNSSSCDSGLSISTHSRKQDLDNDNNVARPASYRRSTGRIYSASTRRMKKTGRPIVFVFSLGSLLDELMSAPLESNKTKCMCAEGRMDTTPAKYVGMAESSLAKFSGREPLPAINNEILIKSIIYEAQRGCINVVGKTKRFDDFLLEQVTAQSENDHLGLSLEARKVFQNLSEMIKQYDQMGKVQRLGLLNKVAETLGFKSLIDLISHGTAAVEASQGLQPFTRKKKALSGESGLLDGNLQNGGVSEKLPQAKVQKDSKPRLLLRQVPGIKYGNSDPIKLPERVAKSSSGVIAVLDTEAPNSSLSEAKTRRKIDLEFSESSRAVQQDETMEDLEVPESFESVAVEGPKTVQLKKTRTRVLQPAEKIRGSLVRSVVNVSNASQTNFDSSTSKSLTEKSKSSTMKAFVIDEKWGLDTPISVVKSLSAPNRARLEENGFNTMRLLLQHFPRMYQNFQQAGQRVEDGQNLSFVGSIVQSRGVPRGQSLGLLEVIVKSEVDESMSAMEEGIQTEDLESEGMRRTVFLHLKRFFKGSRYSNPGFLNAMASKYPQNAQVTVCGKVKQLPQRDHFEIREFNIELWDGTTREESGSVNDSELFSGGKPYPVYPGKGSLQPKTIEFCIQRLLPSLTVELDPIPTLFREQLQIQELHKAYKGIHSPIQAKDAEVARRRLVFDEFFYLQLGMLLQRQELADKCGLAPGTFDLGTVLQGGVFDMGQWSPLTLKLLKTLPYSLTDAQIKATGEIIWDLRRPLPMSRLLQGDVGCGKTVVAFLALLEVLDAGYQGALMAPTEFLAIQHYQRITSWLEKLDEAERPTVALLTGSTTLSKARRIRRGFESGEIALAVGTHSLTSDSVKFSALRLAVIDEQHRFGVSQRGRLNSKVRHPVQTPDAESSGDGDVPRAIPFGAPHILAMSATPIPRTLALAMHGDMSLSQITELPPGRAETTTHAIYGDKKGRQAVYKRVRKELESGGRVFVVFPVIDESEDIPDLRAAETEFKNLEVDFKEFKFGLVHGRMRPYEKEEAMEKFKSGETQVLVSTTVIEVGIDIPEASMIIIEHAERYGMAQLHQLRGRVGRGTRASSCILLGSRPSSLARLKLLETSKDGFYLAEIDLQQRGPGDMLGKRQSGYLPEFNIARLEKDGDVLEQARSAAEELLQLHPKLDGLSKIRYELSIRRPPAPLS